MSLDDCRAATPCAYTDVKMLTDGDMCTEVRLMNTVTRLKRIHTFLIKDTYRDGKFFVIEVNRHHPQADDALAALNDAYVGYE
jgi:hypothetical protein